MKPLSLPDLIAIFDGLPDPRIDRTKQHRLIDIGTMVLLATLSGADSFVEIAIYGRAKEAWLRTFLTHHTGFLRTVPSAGSSPRSVPSPSKRAF